MYNFTSHEIRLDTPTSERTNAFFTSQSSEYKLPTPPRRSATLSSRTSHESHLSDNSATLAKSTSGRSSPPRSSTDSFFSGSPPTPSPPPPLRAPVENGPKSSILPLSRLFPSRYRRSRDNVEDDPHMSTSPPKAFSQNFSPTPPVSPLPHQPSAHVSPQIQSPTLQPIHRETIHPSSTSHGPTEGSTYESDDVKLSYLRCVGQGAFSSVWLARDDGGGLSHAQPPHERRPSENVAGRRRDRKMGGLRPTHPGASLSFSTPRPFHLPLLSKDFARDTSPDNESALAEHDAVSHQADAIPRGRLVAVKMMELAVCDANDRTRISFVREVEVLRVSTSIRPTCSVLHSNFYGQYSTSLTLTSCPIYTPSRPPPTIVWSWSILAAENYSSWSTRVRTLHA